MCAFGGVIIISAGVRRCIREGVGLRVVVVLGIANGRTS